MTMFIIDNGILMLERAEGRTLPSADEVFRSVIEEETVWADVAPGMTSAPESLRFSRFSAFPELLLELSSDASTPVLKLIYKARDEVLGCAALECLEVGHLIDANTWYPLDSHSVSDVLSLLKEASAKPGDVTSLRCLLALKKAAREGRSINDLTSDSNISCLSFAPELKGPPQGVHAELYGYQLAGWQWLRFIISEHVGGLLADEMGLGKTLEVISVLSDPGEVSLSPVLIVAPGSLLENWRREFKRFAPGLSVLKHHGPMRTGRPRELQNYEVIITSYETVVRDHSIMLMVEWGAVIIDEAQNIKNPEARRTKALKELRRSVALAVTGTPVENNLMDAWSIMDFVLPGYLGNEEEFEKRFENDLDGALRLEPYLSPLMLRRRVSDVAKDLPTRIDIPQVVELDEQEAASYEDLRLKIFEKYGKSASLAALTFLRMFCCHPSLLDEGVDVGKTLVDPTRFSKFKRLDEILEEIISTNEKVIVFTSFTAMSDLISTHVKQRYDIFSGCLDGRLGIDERQPLIDVFTDVQGSAVLVLNPRAGGTGLNITAANHVVHYNLEWNPAIEDQASARVYRWGQELPVIVHRLFSGGTIEEVIDERLSRKREVIGASVVGVSGEADDYEDILSALQRSPILKGEGGGE
ncbi:MAG: DEAD/DEAH box helicase [Rhodospirillales bacterium]|nr:DEAD/DEAH box helicase [Rhodospirillales bacterium]